MRIFVCKKKKMNSLEKSNDTNNSEEAYVGDYDEFKSSGIRACSSTISNSIFNVNSGSVFVDKQPSLEFCNILDDVKSMEDMPMEHVIILESSRESMESKSSALTSFDKSDSKSISVDDKNAMKHIIISETSSSDDCFIKAIDLDEHFDDRKNMKFNSNKFTRFSKRLEKCV